MNSTHNTDDVVACVGGVTSNVEGARPLILIPTSLWRKVEAEARRRGGMFEGHLVAEVLDDWIRTLNGTGAENE